MKDETLEDRVERLEAAVFRAVPRAQSDGWITNGYVGDAATMALLQSELGAVYVGEPKPTPQRGVAELKADGIVGLYTVPGK